MLTHPRISFLILLLSGGTLFAELLSNPGFEDELSEWAAKFDYDMSRASPEAARTGEFGLRVTDEDPLQGSGLQSLPVEAVPGQKFRVTFWARTVAGTGGLRVGLCFFDGDEKRLQKQPPSVEVRNCPEWKRFQVEGVAPEEAVAFYVQISSVPLESATVDLDDFSCSLVE